MFLIHYISSLFSVGVEFVEEPMDMDVRSGDIVTLNCSITGSEPITYTWYKDGVRLEARRSSMLVFHPISSFDSGVYRCTALNAVNGLASRVFTVSGLCEVVGSHLHTSMQV